MELATFSEAASLGAQRGKLEINKKKVVWKRYGYIFRQFTMEHPVHSAVFANFAHSPDPHELWIVVTCSDRTVHSYGLSSGTSHVMGLNFTPGTVVTCGSRGIVLTVADRVRQFQALRVMQSPEGLLQSMVPSSVSSPLHLDDKLVYTDENVAVAWHDATHRVRAYAIKFVKTNEHLDESDLDAVRKAAVLSPIREWTQASLGTVFGQTVEHVQLRLIGCADPKAQCVYILCGPDLVKHDGITSISPVAGVFGFPGVVAQMDGKLVFNFLFSPNSPRVPICHSGGELESEAEHNWVQNGSERLRLNFNATPLAERCFDIVFSLFNPRVSIDFLAQYISAPHQSSALQLVLDRLISGASPLNASQLVLHLHVLREDLCLSTGEEKNLQQLTTLLVPYTLRWGDAWHNAYADYEKDNKKPLHLGLELPCPADTPPNVFACLLNCIDPSEGIQPPEFVNQRLYPSMSTLLDILRLGNRADVRLYIEQYNMAAKLDTFIPGVRAWLTELFSFAGLDRTGAPTGVTSLADISKNTCNTEEETLQYARGVFRQDLRYDEALRLLQTKEPQKCLFGVYVDADKIGDHEHGQQQELWSQVLANRVVDSAFGRAAIELSSKRPLLWEQLEAPVINFEGECVETGVTLPAVYKSLEAAGAKDPYGVFAHGVALGLSVQPSTPGVDSLWVITSAKLSNASPQLYAGFVYGMGLGGHLASLEDWQFYESLVNSTTSGTMAALLGVSASKLRSRDAKLTKVLSVHIRALLPEGAYASQLVAPEIEQAALVSLGLLYLEHGVRHLTEVLTRELCNDVACMASHFQQVDGRGVGTHPNGLAPHRNGSDGMSSEENEAHKMAVGITLGLINVGHGPRSGLEVLLPLVAGHHDWSVEASETSNGALCALMLAYCGSNNALVATHLQLPRTVASAEYREPSQLFSRALAHHLVLWDQVGQTPQWAVNQLPTIFKHILSDNKLRSKAVTDDLYCYSMLTGILAAMGMRYCGTNNSQVIDTLMHFLETLLVPRYNSEIREYANAIDKQSYDPPDMQYCNGYDQALLAKTLSRSIGAVCLAAAAVTAGTGNLRLLRLLRELYQVGPQLYASVTDTLGFNRAVQIHLSEIAQAIGWLFLGSGRMSFINNPQSASILATFTFLPLLGGSNVSAPRYDHLRFIWALVTEPRSLYIVPDFTRHVKVEVEMVDGTITEHTTPTLLPPISSVACVRVVDEHYIPEEVRGAAMTRGLNLKARETSQEALRAKLRPATSSTSESVAWDEVCEAIIRATLQEMARNPQNRTQEWDVNVLLAFYRSWTVRDDMRVLKGKDVEKIEYLRWLYTTHQSL